MGKKNNKKSKTKSKQNTRKQKNKQNIKNQRVEAPYPHFREFLKSKHPALIVGEQVSKENGEEYKYRKVMHNDKDGRHLNEVVFPNPNPKDNKPMYIAKRVRHEKKSYFSLTPKKWKYPKKDK